MSKQDEKTVADAVKETEEKDNSKEQTPSEEKKSEEKPIGESQPKNDQTVPLSKMMAEKKKRQELEKKLEELENRGQNLEGLDADDLAEEFGVNSEVVGKLINKISSTVSEEFNSKLEDLTSEQRAAKTDKTLKSLLKTALENNPDYKDVANKSVVLDYAKNQIDKGNTNITMSQILKDIYGKVQTGDKPKSMETSSQKNKGSGKVDFTKFGEMSSQEQSNILKDPELKAQYNQYVQDNINL